MANTLVGIEEERLQQKSTLGMSDYVRVVGADGVSYKQELDDVSNKVITEYTDIPLAGNNQSVKDAINGLDTSKADNSDLQSSIDTVNDRIDNIITSPAPTEQEIIDARLGADGVTYPSLGDAIRDQVSDVKSDLSEVWGEVFLPDAFITTIGTSGARLKYDSGSFSMPSSGLYDVTALIDVEDYKSFSLDYSLTPTAGYNTIVVGYFDSTTMLSANVVGYEETSVKDKVYAIPTGTKYIALTCVSGTHPTISFYDSCISQMRSDLASIDNELIQKDDYVTTTWSANARLDQSGGIVSSSIYDVTNVIPVDNSEVYSLDYSLAISAVYAVVGYFSSDTISSSTMVGYKTTVVANKRYIIPSETKYILLTCPTGTHPTISFYKSRLDVIEDKIAKVSNNYERGSVERASSMSAGDSVSVTVGNLKKNTVLGFSANITTFGSLQIGQGKTANNETAYIIIDSTKVEVYSYTGSQTVLQNSYNHGLTIADYIDVCIEESNEELGYAKIRITSNGQSYTINRVFWQGYNKTVYADAISGSYTNCELAYYCADYDKDFWLFGDSYFDHWVPRCLADGYSNFLCDGLSGRKSDEAYEALGRNLNHGKPNTIVWCIGMNNGDTGSAVNSTWQTYYTKLKNLCETNGINLILCTIPNVPTVNNNYKNAIIRSSDYRYIDLAKAVGSDISTSWYSGLLSSDEVHPSSLGDEMIARFMESAIPEITK